MDTYTHLRPERGDVPGDLMPGDCLVKTRSPRGEVGRRGGPGEPQRAGPV